jgi:exodeoxyribonuclease-1
MTQSFYFYDLETSDLDSRNSRIMQFAGQRTDLNLEPIGQPDNILIKITPDVLPSPQAILITGITPQKTLADGITEVEFLRYFHKEIATPGTIFVGFNSIRFDDEFIRFTNYRNYYDAYEWQWLEGRSKWDVLDLVRMTRALRPEGIEWPVGSDGASSNRLELLTGVNNLLHEKAHDALSDVMATIAISKLIKQKQPKLFEYLLKARDKKEVEKLVRQKQPFIYTSGSLSAEHERTTVAVALFDHPLRAGTVFVYDLTVDPEPYLKLKSKELAERLKYNPNSEVESRIPIRQMQFNKCPAVAPLNTLRDEDAKRLKLDLKECEKNFEKLEGSDGFIVELSEAIRMNQAPAQTSLDVSISEVDGMLYEGFIGDADKKKMAQLREMDANSFADFHPEFNDDRLNKLLLLYKAKQFPKSLSADEQDSWQQYLTQKLMDGGDSSKLSLYMTKIDELSKSKGLTKNQHYILEELALYAQSIIPYDL